MMICLLYWLARGGHARVLLGLLQQLGREVLGVCDPELASLGQPHWEGLPVLGDDSYFMAAPVGSIALVNGVGFVPGAYQRMHVQKSMERAEHIQPSLCHPQAFVDPSADIAAGAQIMAGAIINTRASLDHHVVIGAGAHIAPGAILCGNVSVDSMGFVGAGAVIVPGCKIGRMSVVAAGTTAVKDVPAGMTLQAPKPNLF